MPASTEQQLLHAALLCGAAPGGAAVYRLQLFLVANRDLGSRRHQNDFQRALETSVDQRELFTNAGGRGSGEYFITELGFAEASRTVGPVQAAYAPTSKEAFRCTMSGTVAGVRIEIRTTGTRSKVFINGVAVPNAKEACRRLEMLANVRLPTDNNSAVRVLQDLAVDRQFEIEFT